MVLFIYKSDWDMRNKHCKQAFVVYKATFYVSTDKGIIQLKVFIAFFKYSKFCKLSVPLECLLNFLDIICCGLLYFIPYSGVGVFSYQIRVIDAVKYRRIHEEVMKKLDKLENEFLPQVMVDNTEVIFDTVHYLESQIRDLIIANTGQVSAKFVGR
jgi:hypothetical protein